MADINLKLDKNFITEFNKLQKKYGEEFAKINGFDDSKLNYTDFIDNFIDSETVADASVDGSSNVWNKDVRTLMGEMSKPHRKLLAYNKIYHEINKKYGFKTANDWLEAEWNKALYMHDADTSTFIHYCYKGEEMLTIKYNGDIVNLSFKQLYDYLKEEERFDVTINQNAKFPDDLYVQDYDNNKVVWTKVNRIVKHKNDKKMRFVKYNNGISQIVTEDHPIITKAGDISANEVTTADEVFTIRPDYFVEEEKYNPLNNDLGWLVGLALAEGSSQPSSVTIKQKEKPQKSKLLSLLQKYDIPYTEDKDDTIRIKASKFEKFLEKMLLHKNSENVSLLPEYIHYPHDFLDGVVAGAIDGDGTLGGFKNRQCQIRVASETLCRQLSNYLQFKGIHCCDRTPHIYRAACSFKQKLPLFGIAFTLTNEDYFSEIGSVKIANKYKPKIREGNFANKKYSFVYGWNKVLNNTEYIKPCSEVYDITTASGHFICNNVVSHNCFAYDLKDLAERGLFFLENFNSEPPQHLSTFVDFVKEFISFTSNRSSGAVGLPNLIPYMYYFWKKDCDTGYATKSPEYYAKQQIQRFIYAVNQPYVRDRRTTVR